MKLEEQIRREYLKAGPGGKDDALFSLKERGYDDADAEDLLNEWTEAEKEDESGSFEAHEAKRQKYVKETMESGGVAAFVPENVIDEVTSGATEKKKESYRPSRKPLSERIAARRVRNEQLKEALEYVEQEWTNEDGKPSAYEKNRAEVNSAKRKAREETDESDWEHEVDNKTHPVRRDEAWKLNRQEDEFLNYVAKMEQDENSSDDDFDPEEDFNSTDWSDYDDLE